LPAEQYQGWRSFTPPGDGDRSLRDDDPAP